MTTFQEKCRGRIEQTLRQYKLEASFDVIIGASEDYLVGHVTLGGTESRIYIYGGEAGLARNKGHWRCFERYDYSSGHDLIDAFCRYLEQVIVGEK